MKRFFLLCVLLGLNPLPAAEILKPAELLVGKQISDFSFPETEGAVYQITALLEKAPAVVALYKPDCPISRRSAPSLQRLIQEFTEGTTFIILLASGVDADALKEIRALFPPPTLIATDPDETFKRALMARSSAETFILDKKRTLRFRGPIHDQYAIGSAQSAPKNFYLRDALVEVRNGEAVTQSALSAPGCLLNLAPSVRAPSTRAPITYYGRVARILQHNCQNCHRPGQSGSPVFSDYRSASQSAAMIKFVVENKIMPPWHASTWSGPFTNDRSLTAEDRKDLLAWIADGFPEGNPADAPLPIQWRDGWQAGKPDAIIEVPRAIPVKAEGVMPYVYVTVPTNFSEDRWVQSTELRPTAPDVVHHILVFLEGSGAEATKGMSGHFASLSPGHPTTQYGENTALLLPRGARLVFQIHYTPNGRATTDQPQLGLRFTTLPAHALQTLAASTAEIDIPPGEANHRLSADYRFRRSFRLLALFPHLHLRGKAFRYELLYPDGTNSVVLEIPKYDFHWQTRYELRKPLDIPPGTTLRATAWYDNSRANRNNPNPGARVRFGEQSFDEMMIGYFDGYDL